MKRVRYMIHACPQRMWYVNEFLLPSMYAQGIKESEIFVWNDSEQIGNFKSFAASMKYVRDNQPDDACIWHIQDDVILSADFKTIADGINCMAYGFAARRFDKDTWQNTGYHIPTESWGSFQCVCIPNSYAREFIFWLDHPPNGNRFYLMPWTKDGRSDDTIFKIFLRDCHGSDLILDVAPNMVDHIDYIMGGSIINSDWRKCPAVSAYWDDWQRIRDLTQAIDKRNGSPLAKQSNDKRYACYSLKRNYYGYLKVSLASLLHHTELEKVFLLIEDDELPYHVPSNCEIINISDNNIFPMFHANSSDWHTNACAIRVAHGRILPDYVDRVLALDCDTIICDDLSPLWNVDLTGKWFAGVSELDGDYHPYGEDYYNGGVILHNLKQQRADKADEQMVNWLTYKRVPNLDEEALNKFAVPAGKAVSLPTRYNECWCDGYTNDPAIVHYCSVSEWWKEDKPRSEYWREWM